MPKTTLQMMYDKVLVRPEEVQKMTKQGLHLPGNLEDKKEPRIGVVVEVGPGHLDSSLGKGAPLIPLRIAQGCRVLFGAYAGTEVQLDGEKLLVIPEQEIMAVVGEAE